MKQTCHELHLVRRSGPGLVVYPAESVPQSNDSCSCSFDFCNFATNQSDMGEITFLIEESLEGGGYVAKAVNHSIYTQGNNLDELKLMIGDAVRCHFDEDEMPMLIHLHVTPLNGYEEA